MPIPTAWLPCPGNTKAIAIVAHSQSVVEIAPKDTAWAGSVKLKRPQLNLSFKPIRTMLSMILGLNGARMGINDAGVFSLPLGLEPAFVLRFCQNRL
ncbi:MAG TPA: hypothetical protein VFN63_06240 [Pseudolabrys sp.]|nr:hypothetical protein [Pseudolabrys sp.]